MDLALNRRNIKFVLFILLMLALAVGLFLLAPIIWSALQLFVIAALIALPLDWAVRWQENYRIPRWAATLNLLILLVLVVGLLIYFLIPPLAEQSQAFVTSLPQLWAQALIRWSWILDRFPQLERTLDLNNLAVNLIRGAGTWVQTARTVFTTAVGAVASSVLILVTVFYMLLDPWPLLYGIRGLFPSSWWGTIDHLASSMAARIRAWVVGTFALAAIIGVLDYLALLLINLFYPVNLPYVFFFAILGGALEILPVVGPIIAAILPALVGFSLDPVLGLLVLGAFFIIQQLENALFVPLIMHKAVQLHPVTLLFSLLLLSALFGMLGAIIAVPVASIFKVLYDEWYYPLVHDGQKPLTPPKEEPKPVKAE